MNQPFPIDDAESGTPLRPRRHLRPIPPAMLAKVYRDDEQLNAIRACLNGPAIHRRIPEPDADLWFIPTLLGFAVLALGIVAVVLP